MIPHTAFSLKVLEALRRGTCFNVNLATVQNLVLELFSLKFSQTETKRDKWAMYHLRRDHAIGSGSSSWGPPSNLGYSQNYPSGGQKASLPFKAVRLQICQGSNPSRERRLSNTRQTWPDFQHTGENTTAPCNDPLVQVFRSSKFSN
jgi:hypothetical protein